MNRIFLTGDIHSEIEHRYLNKVSHLDSGDVMICLGDFGVLWTDNAHSNAVQDCDLLFVASMPFTTLFIDGNHENFDKLDALPVVEMFGGKVGKVNDKCFHLRRGEIYEIFGKKVFTFGGAVSIDKHLRKVGVTWWDRELPSHDEYEHALDNLDKHDWNVDLVLTHTMPLESIDQFNWTEMMSMTFKTNDPVARFLSVIAEKLTFKNWYCGHFHVDRTFGKVRCLYGNIEECGVLPEVEPFKKFPVDDNF